MAQLFKIEKQDIILPSVREVSLLTEDEYNAYYDYIPFISANWEINHYSDFFYLKDSAENGMVYVAKPNCDYDADYPDSYYEDMEKYDDEDEKYGIGTRPVIRFSNAIPGAKAGDLIDISYYKFTVLSPDTIILNTHISTDVFDYNTNDYSESEIKKRVDRWFEEEIKPMWEYDVCDLNL